jgi:hypothetical protein
MHDKHIFGTVTLAAIDKRKLLRETKSESEMDGDLIPCLGETNTRVEFPLGCTIRRQWSNEREAIPMLC